MLTICAGLVRSGSTYQYNLVRLLYEDAGFKVTAGHSGAWKRFRPGRKKVCVVKRHDYLPELAQRAHKVLIAYRPPTEVMRSWSEFAPEGDEIDLNRFDIFFRNLLLWTQHAQYIQWYWEMMSHPLLNARQTARTLGVLQVVDVPRVLTKLDSLKPPPVGRFPNNKNQDPQTLLYYNHRAPSDAVVKP